MSRSIAFVLAIATAFATHASIASADGGDRVVRPIRKAKPSDEVLRKELTLVQYEVTQHSGTEAPFQNEYFDNHAAGIYVDIVTGEPLLALIVAAIAAPAGPTARCDRFVGASFELTQIFARLSRFEVRSLG